MPIESVLIANRGVIASRVIRTANRMGLRTIAIYSEADSNAPYLRQASEAVFIGSAPAKDSYLNADKILRLARSKGADAIHPGYGFLSENADFAQKCEDQGVAFIGPRADTIRDFGLKHEARRLAIAAGVPVAEGSELLASVDDAISEANRIGFPIILKAVAGGGGIGMKVCEDEAGLREAFGQVSRLATGNFSDGGVFLERFIVRARHVEVQVFGDGGGDVIVLGDRDCSLQRRNQKVIEEAPAPGLPDNVRTAMAEAASALMSNAEYRSAGTVEFLFDADRDTFSFLEVNTRLQVEHGVTEEIFGIDLVEWMIRGAGEDWSMFNADAPTPNGHAVQARLYAEDPWDEFLPKTGTVTHVEFPVDDCRIETWINRGAEVSAHYDPMLAKAIVHDETRESAISALSQALSNSQIYGVTSNVDWLQDVINSSALNSETLSTRALEGVQSAPQAIRVLTGGPETTVQDWPGRLGYWSVGVPPSGPMDERSFRLGNRLLGNAEGTPGLEFAGLGPTLKFYAGAWVCLAGAEFEAHVNNEPMRQLEPIFIEAGQTLSIGRLKGAGLRGYLLFLGGLRVPNYLGSAACFTLGEFGGHAGRKLAAGDLIELIPGKDGVNADTESTPAPLMTRQWDLEVIPGPHGTKEFFTEPDLETITNAEWLVHYNSNRTGVRLIGPKPEWARPDGGEAGLHPSNIHDNPYAIGAVDFTGDMPIILGPDGPSLGGFVCPFVVSLEDRWKLGQLAPGDSVRFVPQPVEAIVTASDGISGRPRLTIRRQGDDAVLLEYGDIVLDLELRARVHALVQDLESNPFEGLGEITPGIRSAQIQFNPDLVRPGAVADVLKERDDALGALERFEVPSRTLWLPVSWQDPAVKETISRYERSVRDDAPWTPNNVEFIRRINGLGSVKEVQELIFDATYLVMGLGDVYLGAPVATPLDPRHRLVTTKYNPARTWTPPNVVGIGGSYLCVYGMEGPGGYQLFGRTVQVWNSWQETDAYEVGKPWLLRQFDRLRFYPVSHEELMELRRDLPSGRAKLRIEEGTFSLGEYRQFLAENSAGIEAFERKRRRAFEEERERWETLGEFDRVAELTEKDAAEDQADPETICPEGCTMVESPLGGVVWEVSAVEGEQIGAGESGAVVEAMKAENHVPSPIEGIVRAVYVQSGDTVAPGAPLFAVEAA